jgi:hypothetical protein
MVGATSAHADSLPFGGYFAYYTFQNVIWNEAPHCQRHNILKYQKIVKKIYFCFPEMIINICKLISGLGPLMKMLGVSVYSLITNVKNETERVRLPQSHTITRFVSIVQNVWMSVFRLAGYTRSLWTGNPNCLPPAHSSVAECWFVAPKDEYSLSQHLWRIQVSAVC